jgi:hypothetical protein
VYPFNSIIAQQEYERLNDVSRDFARGRLQVRFGGRSYSHITARVRQLGAAVRTWRLRLIGERAARPRVLADRA